MLSQSVKLTVRWIIVCDVFIKTFIATGVKRWSEAKDVYPYVCFFPLLLHLFLVNKRRRKLILPKAIVALTHPSIRSNTITMAKKTTTGCKTSNNNNTNRKKKHLLKASNMSQCQNELHILLGHRQWHCDCSSFQSFFWFLLHCFPFRFSCHRCWRRNRSNEKKEREKRNKML